MIRIAEESLHGASRSRGKREERCFAYDFFDDNSEFICSESRWFLSRTPTTLLPWLTEKLPTRSLILHGKDEELLLRHGGKTL